MPRSPCEEAAQEDQVSLPQRQVEAVFRPPFGDDRLVRGGDVAELRQHRVARHGVRDEEDHERRKERHDHRDRKPRDDVARQGSGAPARGGDRTRRYRCNCAQPIPPIAVMAAVRVRPPFDFGLTCRQKSGLTRWRPAAPSRQSIEERHAASFPDAQPRHAAQLLRRARRRGAQGGGRGRHQPDRAGARRRGADRPRARLRDRRLGPPDAGFRCVLRARARARRLPALRRRHPQRRRRGREPQRDSRHARNAGLCGVGRGARARADHRSRPRHHRCGRRLPHRPGAGGADRAPAQGRDARHHRLRRHRAAPRRHRRAPSA